MKLTQISPLFKEKETIGLSFIFKDLKKPEIIIDNVLKKDIENYYLKHKNEIDKYLTEKGIN